MNRAGRRAAAPADVATSATAPVRAVRSSAVVVAATVRRDLAQGRFFRIGLALDLAYGVLNLLVFLFISRALHHPGQQGLGAATSYFQFVAVGIAVMVVAQVTCTQLVSRTQEEQQTGTLETLALSAVPRPAIAVALAAYPFLVGLLRSTLYLIVAFVLMRVDVGTPDWVGAACVLLLGAVGATTLGIGAAAFAVAFTHGHAAARALIVGLGFLSGAYFPVAGLPGWLHPIAAALPTRMAIDGVRSAVAGGRWLPSAGWLLLTVAVLTPLVLWSFSLCIDRSIREGTLARG